MAKVIVSSSPGLLVQSVVAASPVGVRAAEGVEPSSLDRHVKAAAAAERATTAYSNLTQTPEKKKWRSTKKERKKGEGQDAEKEAMG